MFVQLPARRIQFEIRWLLSKENCWIDILGKENSDNLPENAFKTDFC